SGARSGSRTRAGTSSARTPASPCAGAEDRTTSRSATGRTARSASGRGPAVRRHPETIADVGRPEASPARPSTTRVAARAVDAVKVYGTADAAVRALDGVTAEFDSGGFTAVMGPSGSGKSTLLHCMAGLDSLTSGQVFIGDVELGSLSE